MHPGRGPREQVFAILRELVETHGKTVVAVTHDLDLAGRMDRRIQLVDGSVIADDAADWAEFPGRDGSAGGT